MKSVRFEPHRIVTSKHILAIGKQKAHLLEMTFRCSSCLSNVARAHKPPYTATLLGERS